MDCGGHYVQGAGVVNVRWRSRDAGDTIGRDQPRGYGVDFPRIWRQSMSLVDRILKGARPADLPVQQATSFELMINLETARTLGLTIPQSVLARADKVLE
jgi:ABC-type uncharacterized transport system substrate-binding protein